MGPSSAFGEVPVDHRHVVSNFGVVLGVSMIIGSTPSDCEVVSSNEVH